MSEEFPSNNFTTNGTKYTHITPLKTDPNENASTPEKPKRHGKEKAKTFGEQIVDNFSAISYKDWGKHLAMDWFFPEVIRTVDRFLKQIFFGDKNVRIMANGGTSTADRASIYHNVIPTMTEGIKKTTLASKRNFRHIQIVFGSEKEAFETLDEIRESLATNGSEDPVVTVRELYSSAGLPTDNTMNRWGWRDLENVNMLEYENGAWLMEMPPAEPIDRREGW